MRGFREGKEDKRLKKDENGLLGMTPIQLDMAVAYVEKETGVGEEDIKKVFKCLENFL